MTSPEKMEQWIDLLRPDEFDSMVRLLALFERSGSTSPEEAEQWRERIEARRQRLALAG